MTINHVGTYKDNSYTITLVEFLTLMGQFLPVKICMRDLKNMKTEKRLAKKRKGVSGGRRRGE